MNRINSTWEPFIFVGIMAFGMSAVVSFVIIINIGFIDNLATVWFYSWIKAFFIALIPAYTMRKFAIFVLSKVIQR
jgi:hypothetical protein